MITPIAKANKANNVCFQHFDCLLLNKKSLDSISWIVKQQAIKMLNFYFVYSYDDSSWDSWNRQVLEDF